MRKSPIAISRLAIAALAFVATQASGQTTTPKYDQKCLDQAGLDFIQCSKDATTETAKQTCQKEMDEKKKKCKLS
jgi:hypothetical protein